MVPALDSLIQRLPENTPADFFVNASRMYGAAGRHDKARDCYKRFLAKKPTEWRVQLELAVKELLLGNVPGAHAAVQQAIKHGGDEARHIVNRDPNLAQLRIKE